MFTTIVLEAKMFMLWLFKIQQNSQTWMGPQVYQSAWKVACINDLMSTTKEQSLRRLQYKYSSSTEGTIEGNGSSGIQINIRQPKDTKAYEISKAINQKDRGCIDELYSLGSSRENKNLLQVPLLAKKRDDGSIFDTRNMKSSIKSDLKSMQVASFSRQEMREGKVPNNSTILTFLIDEEAPNEDYLFQYDRIKTAEIKTSLNLKDKVFNLDNPQETREEGFSQPKDKHHLKKYMSLNEFVTYSQQSKIDISLDSELQVEVPKQKETGKDDMIKQEHRDENLNQKTKKPLINKENKLTLMKKTDSTCRMTLRDYMYQTEISNKKALASIKETQEEILKQQSKPVGHRYHKKLSLTSPEYKMAKYGVTPAEMQIQLKKDIISQIRQMMGHLQMIEQTLKSSSNSLGTPSEKDLLLLYNTRRNLKEQAHAKIISIQEELSVKHNDSTQRESQELFFQQI